MITAKDRAEENEYRRIRRASGRLSAPGQCNRCFLRGHEETECKWEPSIYANYKTPLEALEKDE